jgi:hypothetical protein
MAKAAVPNGAIGKHAGFLSSLSLVIGDFFGGYPTFLQFRFDYRQRVGFHPGTVYGYPIQQVFRGRLTNVPFHPVQIEEHDHKSRPTHR